MDIQQYTVGPFAENTYLLSGESAALLVDPGFFEQSEFQQFKEDIEESGRQLLAVVLTHAHVDHVLGLRKVKASFDVPVYLSDEDRYLWNNFGSQVQKFGFSAQDFDFDPEPLKAQHGMELGPFRFDVLYTPGHSPDHVSLYFADEQAVIAGDALFREGIGRTDLYRGDFKLLEKSIKEQLYTLSADTKVYPGHGPATTIGHERKANPFVRV